MNGAPRAAWRFPNPATPLGSSAYCSLRFAPLRLLHDLAALRAWHRQRCALAVEIPDPQAALRTLEWWRAALDPACPGAQGHPLPGLIREIRARHALPEAPFRDIADQAEADVAEQRVALIPLVKLWLAWRESRWPAPFPETT